MGKVSEKPICLINQGAGIGDILFLQKAASILCRDYHLVWPILPQMSYFSDYLNSYDIEWVNYGGFYKSDREVDFARADLKFPGPIMAAKYKLIGETHLEWQSYLKISRNFKKERELMDYLGVTGRFALINNLYGTPPNVASKEVPSSDLPIVKMQVVDGFNLFDWCGVIESASEIISVDTAINYLVDVLDTKAERLVMVSRHTPPNFYHIDNLFQKQWTKC